MPNHNQAAPGQCIEGARKASGSLRPSCGGLKSTFRLGRIASERYIYPHKDKPFCSRLYWQSCRSGCFRCAHTPRPGPPIRRPTRTWLPSPSTTLRMARSFRRASLLQLFCGVTPLVLRGTSRSLSGQDSTHPGHQPRRASPDGAHRRGLRSQRGRRPKADAPTSGNSCLEARISPPGPSFSPIR